METNNTTKYTVRLDLFVTFDADPNEISNSGIFHAVLHELAIQSLLSQTDLPDNVSLADPTGHWPITLDSLRHNYWPA